MATTDVDIANRAWIKLGQGTLLTALADQDLVNETYEFYRDTLQRAYPWNFAITRVALTRSLDTAKTITDITQADPGVVTLNNVTGLEDEDYVYIDSVAGMTEVNETYFEIDNVDPAGSTIELKDIDTSGYTAYVSGGTCALALDPEWGYSYAYDLPSDCLRVLEIENDSDYDWRVEGGKIVTDLGEPLNLKYIAQETDPDNWDVLFTDAFVAKLAWEWSGSVQQDTNLSQRLLEEFIAKMEHAGFASGAEGKTAPLPQGSWVDWHT